jgi:hypothetical protein
MDDDDFDNDFDQDAYLAEAEAAGGDGYDDGLDHLEASMLGAGAELDECAWRRRQ